MPIGAEEVKAAKAVAIGIQEKLGQTIPLDLSFSDEDGKAVTLRELITKPTILSLVYYECPGICSPLLNAEAKVLRELALKPGDDYNAITVSFNEKDTPALAKQKKANYFNAIGKPFPSNAWRFLTGDAESIRQLTEAVGFAFERDGGEFIHSATLIALSPEGKIARYLYGVGYLPFDLEMALVEASEGRVGPTINRVLKYCFSYDPEGRQYALKVTEIAGTMVTLFGAGLFIVLSVRRKK